MKLSKKNRASMLNTLAQDWDNDIQWMCEVALMDGVSPGICSDAECRYTCETEPDQQEGYCEECGKQTIVSALVLAELI
jgi:hypothetical protein